ncbi:MAG: D-alanyl-D-alanine carboxypeptidase [Verrucomicrobiae bacterium]|nr:D-alanyl-D-alanine carboxypeptidase [Verrucomicrobiae bacterium]
MPENRPLYNFHNALPAARQKARLWDWPYLPVRPCAEGRIRAKSGKVNRVKCYAGYVDCRSGKKAAFAIMVHLYSGKYAPIKSDITSIMARLADM